MTTVTTLFPAAANTLLVSATAVATAAVPLPGVGGTVRVVNQGPNDAFLAFSAFPAALATVATTLSSPISTIVLAREDVTFALPAGALFNVSAICAAGQTASLYLSVGEGM